MIIPRLTLTASGCSLHQAFVYLKNKKRQSTSLPPLFRFTQLRNKHTERIEPETMATFELKNLDECLEKHLPAEELKEVKRILYGVEKE